MDHPLLATNNVYPVSAHLLRPPKKTPLPQLIAAFTAAISAAAAKRDTAVRLLHERLDHPSFEVLTQALTNGIIETDVTVTDIAAYLKRNGPCLACIAGKLKDTPHPASDHARATRPGDTLYLDLHALPSESLGGKKMSVRLVDSFTSCLFVEGCPSKSARDVYLAIARVVVTHLNDAPDDDDGDAVPGLRGSACSSCLPALRYTIHQQTQPVPRWRHPCSPYGRRHRHQNSSRLLT